MRRTPGFRIEMGRIRQGYMASKTGDLHGAFMIAGPYNTQLRVISSGPNEGWEHVSVSTETRPPDWNEMAFIKDLFWEETEWVIQYHPSIEDYVNHHPYCLHLWRPLDQEIPKPPTWMVGPKNK